MARATLAYLDQAETQLRQAPDPMMVMLWQAKLSHYRPLIERIIRQTERRVLRGEQVPASEKIVSLFEPHADIIVKGSRDVEYGHKINLTTGRSGLILDLVIESGNPADSERFLPMLERHIAIYGEAPHQAAADGGYASRNNLSQAKARGINDMAFHKKAGLRGWVTFLSNDQLGLDPKVVQWGQKHAIRSLPLGVFEDVGGPPSYRLARDADVTVLLFVKQKVVANFAFRAGELGDEKTAEVMKALPRIVGDKK